LNKNLPIFQKVGKIKEAHGLKGEVYVLIFSKDTSWWQELELAQLSSPSEDSLKPPQVFKIERLKPHKDGLIVKLEGINDRNQSEALKSWIFSIPEGSLVAKVGETIYLKEILDFEVYLKDQFVGFVREFSSNGEQDLLVIQNDDQSFEVPFVSDFILNIDFNLKKLFMDFPEGLMNLSEID
jgi:16S rRNA processing protein RimM